MVRKQHLAAALSPSRSFLGVKISRSLLHGLFHKDFMHNSTYFLNLFNSAPKRGLPKPPMGINNRKVWTCDLHALLEGRSPVPDLRMTH
jgi:hypothetical protein